MDITEDMARAFLGAHAETQRKQAKQDWVPEHQPLCQCFDCRQLKMRNLDCPYCQQDETVDYDTLICANCRERMKARHIRAQALCPVACPGYDCPICGATDTDPDAVDPENGECVNCRENRENA